MELVGGDADFRSETEFAAVGESCAGVPIDRRAVHFSEELLGLGGVFCDDAVAVVRAVGLDVLDGLGGGIDDLYREDEVEKFGAVVIFLRMNYEQRSCTFFSSSAFPVVAQMFLAAAE